MRIVHALLAIQQGGPTLANASEIPEGTRRDFSGGLGGQLDGVDAMTYLGEEDVTGRGIHRHGSDLARVRLYRMPPRGGARYLLVHLTAEGRVADLDTAVR